MKVRYGERTIPYPLHLLTGKLQLCGISESHVAEVLQKIRIEYANTTPTPQELNLFVSNALLGQSPLIQDNFLTLTRYEELRNRDPGVLPLILVLEGSSATGKSMLTLPLIHQLGSTRIIGSDSVRQVLRTYFSREEYPELFSHTYQAYRYRQSGPEELDSVVRGFLAQVQLIEPTLKRSIERYLYEGTMAIIEGVHVIPGSIQSMGNSVLELLIHPSIDLHHDMFTLKQEASGLKTVSSEMDIREKEFQDTRSIQDYMYNQASQNGIPIIEFSDYESALIEISEIIIERITHLIELHARR
ncbi:MAG: hypothetical protein ACFFDR_10875 [Candidatus Thorarchaeota archaeon]